VIRDTTTCGSMARFSSVAFTMSFWILGRSAAVWPFTRARVGTRKNRSSPTIWFGKANVYLPHACLCPG